MNYYTQSPIYLLLQSIAKTSQLMLSEGFLFSLLFYPLFFAIVLIVIRFDIYRLSIFILGYFLTFVVIHVSTRTIFYEFVLTIPRDNIFLYLLNAIICFISAFLCFRDAFSNKIVTKAEDKEPFNHQVFFYGIIMGFSALIDIIITAEIRDIVYKGSSPVFYWKDAISSIYWQIGILLILSFFAMIINFITKFIPYKWRIKSSCLLLGILFIIYYLCTLTVYS